MNLLSKAPRILLLTIAVVLLIEVALFALDPPAIIYGIRLLVISLLVYFVLRGSRIATLLAIVIFLVLGGWELYSAFGREWVFVWIQRWSALRGVFFVFIAGYLIFSPAVRGFLTKPSEPKKDVALTQVVATSLSVAVLLFSIVITAALIAKLPFLYADSAVFWSLDSDPASPDSVRASDDGIDVIDDLYVVVNGKLYLKHHWAVAHSLRSTQFRVRHYDSEWLSQFRQAHPELEQYWPDRSNPDGGMKWSRREAPD